MTLKDKMLLRTVKTLAMRLGMTEQQWDKAIRLDGEEPGKPERELAERIAMISEIRQVLDRHPLPPAPAADPGTGPAAPPSPPASPPDRG
jgi:hypothetical protein